MDEVAKVLKQLNAVLLDDDFKAESLTDLYLQKKVLSQKSYFDLRHIAYASLAGADFLVSCDKHFLREKTIGMVAAINTLRYIPVPQILSPITLLERWQKKQN